MVQAEGSEVSLEVPLRIRGKIHSKAHTDHFKFLHHIKDNECLVSPVCEFSLDEEQNHEGPKDKFSILNPTHHKECSNSEKPCQGQTGRHSQEY